MTQTLQTTAETPYHQILHAVKALVHVGVCTFSWNEVRLQLGLDSHEWLYGYTVIYQAMHIDHPGSALDIPERYRRVFNHIERGIFELTPYGKRLLEKEFDGE